MRHGAQNYNNMNYKNTMNVASVSRASRQTQYKPGLDYDRCLLFDKLAGCDRGTFTGSLGADALCFTVGVRILLYLSTWRGIWVR